MRLFHQAAILVASAMLCLLAACSKKDGFTLSGEIENLGDRKLSAIYFDGQSMQSKEMMMAEGKRFQFTSFAAQPVVITLLVDDGSVAGTIIAVNGDNIKLKADVGAPWLGEVGGSKSTAALYAFMTEHAADSPSALNNAIASYIAAHRDAPESAVMLTQIFHTPGNETRADSLLRSIDTKARPASIVGGFPQMLGRQLSADAVMQLSAMNFIDREGKGTRYSPSAQGYSLLAFVADDRRQTDSLSRAIEPFVTLPRNRFRAIEFSMATDSALWAATLRSDTIERERLWAPSILADARVQKLAVPDVPFFILVDSMGNQLERTRSVSRAINTLRKHIYRN